MLKIGTRARVAVLLVLSSLALVSNQAQAQLGLGSLIVTMTSPASGSTVSGTVPVSASVSIIGLITVRGVQFKLDGANLGAEDTSSPYSVSWNTTTTGNGSHTLRAVARDLLGVQYTSNAVTVTVANGERLGQRRRSRRSVQAGRGQRRRGRHERAVFDLLEHGHREQRLAYHYRGRARCRGQPYHLGAGDGDGGQRSSLGYHAPDGEHYFAEQRPDRIGDGDGDGQRLGQRRADG